MWIRIFITVAFVSVVFSKHGKDNGYCTDPKAPPGLAQKPKPNITDQFSVHVQCIIMNKNQTTDVHEYFDSTDNVGAIKQLYEGQELDAWYSYNTNEFIAYLKNTGDCAVSQLSTNQNRFIFGYQSGHMFSAAQALRLSGPNVNEVYMGVTHVRGIIVDHWKSCQYWDIFDATMTVDWYFTAQNPEWDTAVGVAVPVAARVTGIAYDTDVTHHNFDHWYHLFHYKTSKINSKDLETPAGVQCIGRKNALDLPTMPPAFSFMSEFVDKARFTVSFMKEYYSFDEKMVKYSYRPLPSANSPYGTNDLMEIHDFNTGVAYITDTMYGNCTATAIELTFDGKYVDKNHIAMRNTREFFYYNSINYTFEGVKTIRNIDCNSWVGVRNNWPDAGISSIWQWYFATNDWSEVNTGTEQSGTPIQLVIDAPSISLHYEYNIFNFAKNEPDILHFDISACFVNRNRRKFQLNFPGDFKSAVNGNLEMFRYYIMASLVQYLKVSPLRIANLNVYYSTTDIIVVFEILDVAPVIGDVKNRVLETPLDTAATTLQNLVKKGQLAITLDTNVFPNVPAMVASSKDYMETTYLRNVQTPTTKTGYSPGAMAGVGVSLPIVGAALGGVFAFFFFK